ncbi:aryl sulfotransferase, partial [bacterium]|nr:aryl sulfotransferase [bacterium]
MNLAKKDLPPLRCYDPKRAYNGYTLFAPIGGKNVWLIDMQGRFVHGWQMPYRPGDYGVMLTNGHLLYAGKIIPGPLTEFGGFGGVLLEADWDGTIVWEYE